MATMHKIDTLFPSGSDSGSARRLNLYLYCPVKTINLKRYSLSHFY